MLIPITFLEIDSKDATGHWGLSFNQVDAENGQLRLTLCTLRSETITVMAEIAETRQIGALIERVQDLDDDAHALARELLDMLFTLAAKCPDRQCTAFLVWRLCVWITENRKAVRVSRYAA